ncbi:hypothetical protein [Corynebacterium sp. A21]|uniref:hypothetical protein n=1 Tax=Corynebacterium sp. A21 TaxID=3457318 RepID=UPI003FD38E4A
MSDTATILLADKLIALLIGTSNCRGCTTIAPGRYILSEAADDDGQTITAANVVCAVFTWATEALENMDSGRSEVEAASAILHSRFDDALAHIGCANDQVSRGIWDRVILFASRSGYVSALHLPANRSVEEVRGEYANLAQ